MVESLVHLPDAGDHRCELSLRTSHRPAGDQPEAEILGHDVRHRREPGHARVLQVFPVLRGQPEPDTGLVQRRHGACARDCLADRDLVLHVPCAQLHDRRYRGTAPPVRSFIDFACYIALFPQLVAGPIIRYNTVADQLVCRSHTWEKFGSGVTLFILGFAKKVLLANPMGRVADAAFHAQSLAAPDAWFGAVAYTFQIYFDFSGYSDMAIGLGRMIGFEFLKNFDSPYQAESITDFWRRWHISLSTFLRDYLYIPLGGNRKGSRRTYVNLVVVMLLGGLWHGANWTFVAWGAYHGFLLAFERFRGKRSPYQQWPRPVRVAATFVLVLISWVLFRSANLHEAMNYLGAMIGQGGSGSGMLLMPALLYTQGTLLIMAIGAVVVAWPIQAHEWSREVTWPKAMLVHPLFCASLLAMFSQSFNPFLYFQF